MDSQGQKAWRIINKNYGSPIIQDLVQVAHAIDEHTSNILLLSQLTTPAHTTTDN